MKAIRVHQFGGPEVLRLEDVPDPVPGPGQVVVRIRAAGVNPVETYIRQGIYGPKEFPLHAGERRGGRSRIRGVGRAAVAARGSRVHGRVDQRDVRREGALHRGAAPPAAAAGDVRAGGGGPHAIRDRVPGDAYPRAGVARRSAARPRRDRRRGRGGGAARAGVRARPSSAPGGPRRAGGWCSTRRAPRARPSRAGLPREGRRPHRRARVRPDPGDARERQPREGPRPRWRATGGSWSSATAARSRSTRETMKRDASILGMTLMNADDRELGSIHAALDRRAGEGFPAADRPDGVAAGRGAARTTWSCRPGRSERSC